MAKRSLEIKYFAERPFLYDWEEYVLWRAGDKDLINSFLDICGTMGQDRDVLSGPQTKRGHHYPEVKYAAHCVQNKNFQPEFIYYEKYRLSQQFIMSLTGKTNKDAILFRNAHNQLTKIFSAKFFVEFDKLISLNKTNIQRKPDVMISVDLCAILNKKRQVHFLELKKYELDKNNRVKNNHEGNMQDELLFLGFVRHVVDSLGDKAFLNKTYTVITELIVLIPEQDCSRLISQLHNSRKEHYVKFYI